MQFVEYVPAPAECLKRGLTDEHSDFWGEEML